MRVKAILVASIILLSTLVGVLAISSGIKQRTSSQELAKLKDKEERGTIKLRERVQLAKARGESQVVVPGTAVLYPRAASPAELNSVLQRYTVVIARLVQETSEIDNYENIRSWHKFKILEELSVKPPAQTFAEYNPPQELLPIAADEFLLPKQGGTLVIDGVDVIANELGVPLFNKGQDYLLVLSLNPDTKVAEIALGAQSILPINPDKSLKHEKDDHILQHVLKNYYGGNLKQLEQKLRG